MAPRGGKKHNKRDKEAKIVDIIIAEVNHIQILAVALANAVHFRAAIKTRLDTGA